jgi:formate-dependent nitrite reductase membrane component NrfD
MDWPPLHIVGFVIFLILFIVRLVIALIRREDLDIGTLLRFVYRSFGTMMAILSSLVATYFGISGEPYPGKTMADLQLIILITGTIFLCGGLYYYFRDFHGP